MRLFVAIDLPEEIRQKIGEIQQMLKEGRPDVVWVKPDNMHITLKFIGETSEDKLSDIKTRIKEVVKNFRPFDITLSGIGYFGSPKYVRAIWIGGDSGEVKQLMEGLENALRDYRNENREPTIHLTLGRMRSARGREELLQKIKEMQNIEIGKVHVDVVKLKESRLTPKGPIYTDIEIFELKKCE